MENQVKKQKWEMLASPGHVLLARVESYKHKTKTPVYFMIGALSLSFLTFAATPFLASGAGGVAGWVTSKVSSVFSVTPLAPAPAPAVNRFRPVVHGSSGLVEFPKVESVEPAMKAQVQMMIDGKSMEDCDFSKKINESWFDGVDVTPKCRYSKDKDRLWVWSVVNFGGVNKPWAGLIVKTDGKVTLANIDVPGVGQINGIKSINPDLIPRTISMDFPELAL